MSEHTSDGRQPRHHALEVGITFLKLGLTSFGGPIAHIGKFRKEFVDRRRWLDESAFADLSPYASSCRGRRAAKFDLQLDCCVRGGPAPSRPGQVSRFRLRFY